MNNQSSITEQFVDKAVLSITELKTKDLLLTPSGGLSNRRTIFEMVSRQQNNYRQIMCREQRAVRQLITPMIKEHGSGIVGMFHLSAKDRIQFGFIPQAQCEATVKECFTKAAGEKLWQIVEPTLQLFNWAEFVPVLSVSSDELTPSFFFVKNFNPPVKKGFAR